MYSVFWQSHLCVVNVALPFPPALENPNKPGYAKITKGVDEV